MRGLLREYYIKNNQPMAGTSNTLSSATKDPISKLAHEQHHRSGSMMANKSNGDLLLLHDQERPKTKADLQMFRKKEKERLQVQRAADRREHWVNMVVNDPDFLLGFQQGSLPLFHTANFKFRDFSLPGHSGLTGSVLKTSLEKNALNKAPSHLPTDYDEKQPTMHPVFRDRGTAKEVTSPITKYTHKDQRERIQDKIQGTVPLSTEPINTLLLARPKWREHDESKWVGGKEFISQNSKKDQPWQPVSNVRQEFPEPFMDPKVQFRQTSSKFHTPGTMSGLVSSSLKQRNLSQVKTHVPQVKSQINFRSGSPQKSSDDEDGVGLRNAFYDGESPMNARNFQMQPFDSTVPTDKTWGNRVGQSISLRQTHHLNQSLKLRKNLLQNNDSHKIIDIRAQIMVSQAESPLAASVLHIVDQPKASQASVIIEERAPAQSPERNIASGDQTIVPQSPFTQINSASPNKFQATFSQSKQHKPPLPKKEQMINLEKTAPDVAAAYLNNDFQVSYPNTWQYQVTAKAPATYFNKNFEEKEEIREAHVLWELDKEKTYYKSAMEKMSSKKVRQEAENERMRRTNIGMALNSNIMEKTVDPSQYNKGSGSLKKLPTQTTASKKNSQRKMTSTGAFETPMDIYEKTNISPYITQQGQSPAKTVMNMTTPKGFMSPKNSIKKGSGSEMKKQDIQDVVKCYFDKTGGSPTSPSLRLAPPTTASALSAFKQLEIEPVPFSTSPQK